MTEDLAAHFRAAGRALEDAGDKAVRREVYAGFRRAVKPLADKIIRDGSAEMPHRGGFGAVVAAAKIGQSNSTRGRNPGVTFSLRTAKGATGKSVDLKTVDDGTIRHPDFGDRKVWRVTHVRPGAFRRPFEAGRDTVAREVVAALEHVAHDIAARTNQGA